MLRPAEELDGGYGWIVCAASFLAHVVVLGSQYSIGVLLSSIIDELGQRALTSFVSSIAVATMLFSGVFVGRIVGRVGPRAAVFLGAAFTGAGMGLGSLAASLPVLFLTFGLVTGFGFSLGFAPSVFVVNEWFDKRRALANGIAVSGSGIGTMVLPPILELLIRRFGWRGSLQIQAVGAAVLLGLCAATYRHPRPEASLDKEGREMAPKGDAEGPSKASPFPPAWERSLCNSPVFVTFCLSVMLCAVGYFVPFVHLVTYMEDAGSTRAEGAFAVALIGLASTVGRVVFGWMTDHMGITALTMFQCSTFVTGVSTALVPLAVGSSAIYVYSILFGLFAGAFIALMPVFVAEELSPKAVRRGMSVIYTVQTPSVLLGSPAAGALAEMTGSYTASFVGAGLCMVGGSLLLLAVRCSRGRKAALVTPVSGGANEEGTVEGGEEEKEAKADGN